MSDSLQDIKTAIREEGAYCLYLSTNNCNVCKSLKPKLKELLNQQFPNIKFKDLMLNDHSEIKAEFSVFTVPTIIFYFQGTEHYRKSRYINLREVKALLERPYRLLFG